MANDRNKRTEKANNHGDIGNIEIAAPPAMILIVYNIANVITSTKIIGFKTKEYNVVNIK